MHALLLAAALAVGSGDGRDGATDGRTVDKTPPYARLRVGMDLHDAESLMFAESTSSDSFFVTDGSEVLICRFGPDLFGRYHTAVITAKNGRIAAFEVEASMTSNRKR